MSTTQVIEETPRSLNLRVQGRIIDHLGIQMYQSPVAAVAEMVSNSWDADAENVWIELPSDLNEGASLIIKDDGTGMTFDQCEERYLNVGLNRRGDNPDERSSKNNRPILGRKGIGKFAGFGIASIIEINTISEATGELTRFELDLNKIRGEEYVIEKSNPITVLEYKEPDAERGRVESGTTITLKNLTLKKRPNAEQFAASMSRRFLLHKRAADFTVFVNNKEIPKTDALEGVEFSFPKDYDKLDLPNGVTIQDNWAIENLTNGKTIRWQFVFFVETVDEQDLRGAVVYSKGKLAQAPFFFNLTGGLGGQHGTSYFSGQVEADYLDKLKDDVIATERQRINWDHPDTIPLEKWGQQRIKDLLKIWHRKRGEKRRKEIEQKVAGFAQRLENLPPHEKSTVKKALNKLGSISSLSNNQFQEIGQAILKSWEQGRLKELIHDISQQQEVSSDTFLELLTEADVLIALNIAEVVKTKLEAIKILRKHVEAGELENKVRDFIADRPYIIEPKWETFKKETSLKKIFDEAAAEAGLEIETPDLTDPSAQRQRIDLALRSAEHLLVLEFMRPGKTADFDHLSRIRKYIYIIRNKIESQTELGITKVTGLVVADRLENDPALKQDIEELKKMDVFTFSWDSLLKNSEKNLKDFLDIVSERAPTDERLQNLHEI